jgi:uracil-DNA glycosylase
MAGKNVNGKPLLVGQAPGPSGDNSRPLSGRIGKRLAQLMGVSFDAYLSTFDRINLLASFPGKSDGKGDKFPLHEAREIASLLDLGGRPFVLLMGRGVARAFGMIGTPWLEWFELRGANVAVVPHPSGVNRWWNDAKNEAEARSFLASLPGMKGAGDDRA